MSHRPKRMAAAFKWGEASVAGNKRIGWSNWCCREGREESSFLSSKRESIHNKSPPGDAGRSAAWMMLLWVMLFLWSSMLLLLLLLISWRWGLLMMRLWSFLYLSLIKDSRKQRMNMQLIVGGMLASLCERSTDAWSSSSNKNDEGSSFKSLKSERQRDASSIHLQRGRSNHLQTTACNALRSSMQVCRNILIYRDRYRCREIYIDIDRYIYTYVIYI